MTFISYAQNFEDVMLWRALNDVEKGFYIDVGANDPVIDSVSMAFYEHGWRGISVEPTEQYANLLRQARPDEIIEQVAIGREAGSLNFYDFPDTGLSTVDDEIAQRHNLSGFICNIIQLPVITLDDLFNRYAAAKQVHWLKVDVEGHEKEVLAGWKESYVRPWIIVVESTLPLSQESSHQEWEWRLLGKDYIFAYADGLNRFYVAQEHSARLSAFLYPPNVFDHFSLNGTASHTFHRYLTASIGEIKNQVSQLESAAQQAEGRAQQFEQAAQQAEGRAQQFEQAAQQAEGRAQQFEATTNQLHAHIASVYASKSWRITRPLRGIRRILRGDFGPVVTVKNGLKRRIKNILLRLIAYVRHRPQLKRRALWCLQYMPYLNRRLRKLNADAQMGMLDLYEDTATSVPSSPLGFDELSPQALRIYQKFKLALECRDKGNW